MNRQKFANTWVKGNAGEVDQLPEEIEPGHTTYKLVGRQVLPCELMEWAAEFDNKNNRIIARDEINNGKVSVSTVFLGYNHQWAGGPPILFETMIFGGEHADRQWRCSTYAEAEKQHKKALEMFDL